MSLGDKVRASQITDTPSINTDPLGSEVTFAIYSISGCVNTGY